MITFKYLLEKFAHQTASRMGLEYYGFGRYGKSGEVTYVSKFDTLKPVHKVENFRTLPGDILTHLQHADDEVFNNGVKGVRNALDHLHALKYKHDRVKISQKIDGAPSVVLGIHPETKKFFVASKSAFNKDPKINYTPEDIDRNHGHAPGLAAKLKELLKHGPKLGIKGIVQGDMLYGEHDKEETGGKVSFKPNTIRYSIPSDHEEGVKVSKSKIGVALHTEYDKDGKAVLNPNIKVKSHPDVYNMPVAVDPDKMNFDHSALFQHQSAIGKTMNQIPAEGWEAITHPSITTHAMTYINSKVRKGETDYNVDELMRHIATKSQKEINAVKTDKSKEAKKAKLKDLLSFIGANEEHLTNAFTIQKHIVDAKHHIIDRLNTNQTFEHTYENGEKANPEGYVLIGHHGPIKLVNRADFSRQNFNVGTFKK